MLDANRFDLWKKDGLFSAAEQVQESADTMEFAFRTWVREKREGLNSDDLDELRREVQTALGTAKWQLEEFEKAVGVSYRSRSEEHALERHRMFIAAIGNQISHVEAVLRESYDKVGKRPLRWVNLNKEECNDLAAFLSGISQVPHSAKTESSVSCYEFRSYKKRKIGIGLLEERMWKIFPALRLESAATNIPTLASSAYMFYSIYACFDVDYILDRLSFESIVHATFSIVTGVEQAFRE
ncbi:hypothetical protein SDJN03_18809, partial [Cucurbita argyrosperma subsp. sororia]